MSALPAPCFLCLPHTAHKDCLHRHAPTEKLRRLVDAIARVPLPSDQSFIESALYHVSPFRLEGDKLLCDKAVHGATKAIWASPSLAQSAAHVCRSLRHHAAIVAADYVLQVYRFPEGSPQHALFGRFALPAAPGEWMYSTARGSARLGEDVPMVRGEWVCARSTVDVRSYFSR